MKKIQVLGTGCSRCHKLTEIARQTADRLGKPYELEYVTDAMRFAELGVMAVPALVIDGKVVAVGRVPRVDEITAWLEDRLPPKTASKSTSLVRAALLLVVAASLVTWAVTSLRESPTPATAAPIATAPTAKLIADGVAVVNFHGALRCPTCLGIGALSQAIVDEEFPAEKDEGRIAWSSIDFDQPENAHYKDDYELVSSSVVVVRREHGVDVGWKRLDDVWTHYGDEPVFRSYVHAAVAEALAQH